MRSWCSLLFVILFGISCEERFKEDNPDPGYDYFPVEVGKFWIYDVMAINYDASGPDTMFYELRNTIAQQVRQGNTQYYTVERESRVSDSDPWEVLDVWSLRRDPFNGIVVEENVPYVKMTFPAVLDKTWDGHAYNHMEVAEYEYRIAPAAAYDAVIGPAEKILVQISDIPQNLVNRDQRFEVYAKGIGLVEKNYIVLNYCTSNCGSEEVDSGMIIEQVLKVYGQN